MDNLISRQAVLDAINTDWHEDLSQLEDAIKALPPVSSSEKPNKSEWQHDHEILKAYSDGANDVLDKISESISLEKLGYPPSADYYKAIVKVLQIIDEYRPESEVRDDKE